ncbi:MAG: MFS transporter [Bacteroidaceae bacterium]|nr:MFS transporter [Bacteroidaceae bacterium]
MGQKKNYGLGPFVFLTFIYFLVGFLTTINGQLQGPLKIAFLQDAGDMKNTFTTMLSLFFFLGYLLNSRLAGKWIDKKGYQTTMVRALVCMVAALLCYGLSASPLSFINYQLPIAESCSIPFGFVVFLLGSFLMGTSAAILQVVINPYVSAYELPGTQPAQRLNIVTAVNSFGTTIAPFFVTLVIFAGVSLDNVTASQVFIPFMVMVVAAVLVAFSAGRMSLPDLSATRAEGGSKLERSVWSFRHLTLGVIAIFFYVGTEVSIGSNLNLHAMELIEKGNGLSFFGMKRLVIAGMDMGIPALLATLYWGGFLVGRFVSTFFSNFNPRKVLIATTIVATLLILAAIQTENLWLLSAVGLVHSVMWSCIFTLSIRGLREYTSKASGVFMMGVFGGAVFPFLQGVFADILNSWQYTWVIALLCELVMLAYGLYGYKVKDQWCLENIEKMKE